MSSQLLAECLVQIDHHGFESGFQSYFSREKSRLLGSNDVACGLVVLTAQENDTSGHASRLLSVLLEEARMGLENDNRYARDFLETVEATVLTGRGSNALQQEDLMKFAGLYRQAGLTVPQSFILDPDNMTPPPNMEGFDLTGNLEKVASDIVSQGGSAFDLFSVLDSMLAAIPEEIQANLANHIATMDGQLFERCALFMLLSGSKPVQDATIAGLFKRFDTTGFTDETIRLLPVIRGWFTSNSVQSGLDKLIRKTRRTSVGARNDSDRCQLQEVVASITDGVGAQSIAIVLKQGSRTLLATVLIKTGYGIKDSFLVPVETRDDTKYLIAQLRTETGADDISDETLRVLLEGGLADGLKNNHPPAAGFLDVIETCNLLDLRPQTLDSDSLLNLADPEGKILNASAQALGRWINDDLALARLDNLTDSWFEDTEETREIVATGRTERSIESKIWKFLESRRDLWARRFLQTAVMLRDGERLREWKTLTATAYGLMNERPLKRIPLMKDIVYTTIEAADMEPW